MEKLTVGLAILAVGGAAWLAYYQPRIYVDVARILICIIFAVFLLLSAYNFGTANAESATFPYLQIGKFSESHQAVESYRIPFWILLVATFGSITYLVFLGILSERFEKEKPHGNQNQVNVEQNSKPESEEKKAE